MKKRILSVLLIMVMVLTMLSGCNESDKKSEKKKSEDKKTETSQENSSYFKELKELTELTKGTSTTEISLSFKSQEEIPQEAKDMLQMADGTYGGKIIAETITESQEKAASKMYLQLGTGEKKEILTYAVDGTVLYLEFGELIEIIRELDAEAASEFEAGLQQMGIGTSVKLDVNKIVEALTGEVEMPELTPDQLLSVADLANKLVDSVENSFSTITGQDGDEYTLTVGSDNAETVVDALISFVEKDSANLINDVLSLVIDIVGADSEIGLQIQQAQGEEFDSEIASMIEEIKAKRDNMVKELKDANINIVSKVLVTGEDGSRTAKFSIDSGEIIVDEGSVQVAASTEFKEEDASIQSLIPADSADITTLVITLINTMEESMMEESATELY